MRTALLGIRSEIFGSESQGQVGGMEGSEELRREYARLSLGWCCRECGVGNLEAMRELWGVCRERGVEVEGEVAAVDGGAGVEGQRKTVEAGPDALAPAPASASSGNDIPIGIEEQARAHDVVESTPAAESVPAPAQVSAVQAQPQTPLSTIQAPAAAVMPMRTSSSQLASTESPSEGVWLDRAIIGVVVALVLLILRRVANVDDL